MWRGWLQHIQARLAKVPTVQFEYLEPEDLSNKAPRLRVRWDEARVGAAGSDVVKWLDAGTPRIMVDGGGTGREAHVIVMPYMMDPGEERIVADAIYAAMFAAGTKTVTLGENVPVAVTGTWVVTVQYLRGEGVQHFTITQDGDVLSGHHKGEIYEGGLHGDVDGNDVEIRSRMDVPGNGISWTFVGTVAGNRMSGKVDMGEYGPASFVAVRA